MRISNAYKGLKDYWPDLFSRYYVTWASNHQGWAKAKRKARRVARKRIDQRWRRDMRYMGWEDDYDTDYESDC